jgi:hypothetical protein
MAKVINITDKLSNEKPVIVIGDKKYPVNNTMAAVMKFEELSMAGTQDKFKEAFKIALGEKNAKEIGVETMSIPNFKVLNIAILAAMQDLDYDEAAARFQKQVEK